ncbi:carbohydrate-binding domain-containing protein [Azospirillum sp.]|uniref:carbohydrate-binding domain-containing protein n=1 Tax=Azospirillum sp. TaxID=34012 RepID=UPI003D735A37
MALATNGSTGAKGTVVVIDSGWSSAWNTGTLVYQQDFLNGDNDAKTTLANTHGALVTSEIVSKAPDAGIIELKVLPDDGSATSDATIEKALQWVVANADAYNVVAVNLSLAGGAVTAPTTTSLSDEIAALAAKRVLTVAAAGNAGQGDATQDVSYYAADSNVVCVSASTGDGQFPTWAQRSPALTDICADGTQVMLTNLAGQSYLASGSSFAAPAVTAALAQAQDMAMELRGSRLSLDEFVSLAKETGTPVGGTGYADLNADALLAKLAATYKPPVAGTASIVVSAHGTAAGGVNAHFNVLIDGQKVGEATAGTTAKDYAFTAGVTPDAGHKVQVQYDNDTAGRDLFVDRITINGKAVAPTDPIVSYDKGALDGKDVVAGQSGLWWNGTLVADAGQGFFPAAGTPAPAGTAIVVNAQGSAAAGVYAHFNVLVDGVKVGEGMTGATAKDFAFTATVAADAAHKVQVQYDNDTSGRDLFVNRITIGGHAVAPTDAIVSYDKGALDGRDVVPGQSGLWWNGTLVVSADKAWFPAPSGVAVGAADALLAHAVAQGQTSHDAVGATAFAAAGTPVEASFDAPFEPYAAHHLHADGIGGAGA